MKYIFFGTPEFAAIILEKLIKADFIPEAIICNPDRPVGRKKIITPPPTKLLALKYGIKVYQPEKLEIRNLKLEISKIDFAIVASYAKILPKEILTIPRLGTIGVHPSLLPKYRGATPIQSVILNGEKETGVTLFLMDEQIDHGPITANTKFQIPNSKITYLELLRKLAEVSGDLLIETLPKFLKGEYTLQPQNDKEATYAKKFSDEDAYVDLEKDDPVLIERKVRALNPEPGVFTLSPSKGGFKRMKILEAEIIDGKLKLKKIQFEGKKPIFIR